jgi:hypothetical protein
LEARPSVRRVSSSIGHALALVAGDAIVSALGATGTRLGGAGDCGAELGVTADAFPDGTSVFPAGELQAASATATPATTSRFATRFSGGLNSILPDRRIK